MTTSVAICALTFRRPRGLASLLESLAGLESPGPDYRVQVVIVDNDPEESARRVVESAAATMPWAIDYATETRRGIPFGRNRALTVAGRADFVAFLDDDEIARPDWLTELLRVQGITGGDVVAGTVLPDFEVEPPAWIVDGGFFDRRRYPTGHSLNYATTSNVLISAPVIEAAGQAPFAESMALNGGDDTHFFMRANDQGFSIVWADDAVVCETIPESRLSARWLLQREYRRGNTLSLCLRDLHDTPMRRVRRTVRGLLEVGRGVGEGLIGVVRGRTATLKGLKHAWFGAGLLVGLIGVQYEEYRVTHGS